MVRSWRRFVTKLPPTAYSGTESQLQGKKFTSTTAASWRNERCKVPCWVRRVAVGEFKQGRCSLLPVGPPCSHLIGHERYVAVMHDDGKVGFLPESKLQEHSRQSSRAGSQQSSPVNADGASTTGNEHSILQDSSIYDDTPTALSQVAPSRNLAVTDATANRKERVTMSRQQVSLGQPPMDLLLRDTSRAPCNYDCNSCCFGEKETSLPLTLSRRLCERRSRPRLSPRRPRTRRSRPRLSLWHRRTTT